MSPVTCQQPNNDVCRCIFVPSSREIIVCLIIFVAKTGIVRELDNELLRAGRFECLPRRWNGGAVEATCRGSSWSFVQG